MKNFEKIYSEIKKVAPAHHFEFTDSPFWILITTILSQRTKDAVTDKAARLLYETYHDSYGLENADPADIKKIIKFTGFSNVKSLRLIEIAKIINHEYGGKVPNTHEELIKLPGTGSKTANIVLTQGFNIPAIAVDTHVFRISNRIGLVKTKTPDETEEALKKVIPVNYQIEFNPVFVEFGKNICKPVSPKCNICPISDCCDFFLNNKNKDAVKKTKK
ncbi:endonuclease III [Ferroplasma sp.]|uniref:endonuclease III domain-containing protein n=1 Tax=Ferroplasma sp. TaxID=2591003 RepID=UPI00307CCA40